MKQVFLITQYSNRPDTGKMSLIAQRLINNEPVLEAEYKYYNAEPVTACDTHERAKRYADRLNQCSIHGEWGSVYAVKEIQLLTIN